MFVVVDIETTGLSAYYHQITEISAVKYSQGQLVDFTTLVNPQARIPRFITKLTGIDNEMVADAPLIQEVMPQFMQFLGEDVFVGHNATFDFNFLNHAAHSHLGYGISNDCLCTCKLARRLLMDLPRKNLSSVCQHFDVRNDATHRAKGDAMATMQVLEKMLDLLKEKKIESISDILSFQKSKIIRE